MRMAIPSEIELSHTTRNRAYQVELKFKLSSGGEVECRYRRVRRDASDRARLVSCTGGRGAGDIVSAREVELEVETGSPATARVVLTEASPCGPDAGTDASTGGDTGAGGDTGTGVDASFPDAAVDASVDSSPGCTPATCLPASG